MNKKVIYIIILSLFIFSGCARKAVSGVSLSAEATKEIVQDEPKWYTKVEERKGYKAGKGEGVSRDKRGARKKAMNAIINDFQQKTKAITEGRSDDFFKEVGSGASSTIYNDYKDTQITIWNGSVSEWVEWQSATVVEKSVDENGRPYNIFRHYIIGGIDEAAADRKLLQEIQRKKELATALEGSKAYNKLLEDLERYKDKF
tara:strand:- start:84 stop:689 length:606 start_codon:yes stop_codon:yes gene_type:complete